MVKLKVNGVDRSFEGNPDMPLLWYLRDTLGMTGTKFGCCRMALCGACTVPKHGKAIRSSIAPMSGAAGTCGNRPVRTETSLRSSPAPNWLPKAPIGAAKTAAARPAPAVLAQSHLDRFAQQAGKSPASASCGSV